MSMKRSTCAQEAGRRGSGRHGVPGERAGRRTTELIPHAQALDCAGIAPALNAAMLSRHKEGAPHCAAWKGGSPSEPRRKLQQPQPHLGLVGKGLLVLGRTLGGRGGSPHDKGGVHHPLCSKSTHSGAVAGGAEARVRGGPCDCRPHQARSRAGQPRGAGLRARAWSNQSIHMQCRWCVTRRRGLAAASRQVETLRTSAGDADTRRIMMAILESI